MPDELQPASGDPGLGVTVRGFGEGQRLFDRYVLRRVLGRGGMGLVWLAFDEQLEREIALKFLPELVTLDKEAIADLKRETRRSLELTHPHIVRIYDLVQDKMWAGISMEYVEGDTLSAHKIAQSNGHFEVEKLRPWVGQLCDALDYAHTKAKVVHRDLKPANLMINIAGDLKVADFGISRSMSDTVSRVTMRGGTGGTLAYMSPQQAQGVPAKVTDDVYSLGATLYDLLSGKPPFYSGNIQHQLDSIVPDKIGARREDLGLTGEKVPREWEETIAQCLEKDPSRRPQSVTEISMRLGLRDGVVQRPKPKRVNQEKSTQAPLFTGNGWIPWGAGALVVLLLGGGIYLGILHHPVASTALAANQQNSAQAAPVSTTTVATDNAEAADYRIKAIAGDAEAARKLGLLYYYGQGVPKSLDEGLKWLQFASDHADVPAQTILSKLYLDSAVEAWFQKMAANGDADAEVGLGYMYEKGFFVPQNYARALSLYQKAADQQNSEGINNLGNLYNEGKGVPKDYTQALSYYQKASDMGNSDAQMATGTAYQMGWGVEKDYGKALALYQISADRGNPTAQTIIGKMYMDGQGVAQDYDKALSWFQKAADQGYAFAQNNLGVMYQHGWGVPQDNEKALAWFQKAADQGTAVAQTNIGNMYIDGVGVAKDYDQALIWYQRAAAQNNAAAQTALGTMYQNGSGISRDDREAVILFRKAADQGIPLAQTQLGLMFALGRGTEKDIPTAVRWLRKAAAQGEPNAQSALKRLGY